MSHGNGTMPGMIAWSVLDLVKARRQTNLNTRCLKVGWTRGDLETLRRQSSMIFGGFVGRFVEVEVGRRKRRMRKSRNDGKVTISMVD